MSDIGNGGLGSTASGDDRSARVLARASWSRLAEPGDEVRIGETVFDFR